MIERSDSRPDLGELRDLCRRFLADRQPVATLDDPDAARALWQQATELGWPATLVPEPYGGMDWGWPEAAVVATELGRACAPGPFLSTGLIAPACLCTLTGDRPASVLAALASGDERVAAAGLAPHRQHGDGVMAVAAAGRSRLHGRCAFVLDAADATSLLVFADAGGAPAVAIAPVGDAVELLRLPLLDQSRTAAVVTFRDAPADVLATGDDARRAIDAAQTALALGIACDARGGAEAVFDAAVQYAKERVQFGRPIGSFQAIKHRLADLYVLLQGAIAVVDAAVEQSEGAAIDARIDADLAVAQACDAFARVAGDSILVHGAIGFTWEHTMHRYLKRAMLDRQLAGSPAALRERHLVQRFELAEVAS